MASEGDVHPDAKVLKGFHGRGVLELIEDHRTDTFRAVYTIKYPKFLYVLHVFKKKSKKGGKTPKEDRELIESRLKFASQHCKELTKKAQKKRL
ncbi:MAG: hypothetical protein S4CHLAM2_10470 [Chlamydiales bacterium]|nr:hypothetical protein [Chlamydiales bacterium]